MPDIEKVKIPKELHKYLLATSNLTVREHENILTYKFAGYEFTRYKVEILKKLYDKGLLK